MPWPWYPKDYKGFTYQENVIERNLVAVRIGLIVLAWMISDCSQVDIVPPTDGALRGLATVSDIIDWEWPGKLSCRISFV